MWKRKPIVGRDTMEAISRKSNWCRLYFGWPFPLACIPEYMGYSCYHRRAASDAEGWDALWLAAPCGKSHRAWAPVHSSRECAAPNSGYLQCFHLAGRTSTWSCHIHNRQFWQACRRRAFRAAALWVPRFHFFCQSPHITPTSAFQQLPLVKLLYKQQFYKDTTPAWGLGCSMV